MFPAADAYLMEEALMTDKASGTTGSGRDTSGGSGPGGGTV